MEPLRVTGIALLALVGVVLFLPVILLQKIHLTLSPGR
jgi:hypothetical protein